MELTLKRIKDYDVSEIYNELKKLIDDIYKGYKYTGISEEEYKNIVYDVISTSKQKYDGKTKFDNYIKKIIIIKIINYTKNELKNNEKAMIIINNYINKLFKPISDYKSCINNIKNLLYFF